MHSACRWCRSCGETEDEGSDIVVGAGGRRGALGEARAGR